MLGSFFHSAVFFLQVFPEFNIGEGAEFVSLIKQILYLFPSLERRKVDDMLDICRGRDLGDVNIALSKILFLMTVWQKRRAGMGRFSNIIKVVEHDCSPKWGKSFYGAETLFMWQCYSISAIPPLGSKVSAPPEYLKCAWLQKWTICGSVSKAHGPGMGSLIVFIMSRIVIVYRRFKNMWKSILKTINR